MGTLLEIRQISIPHIPDLRQPPSRPSTATYAPVTALSRRPVLDRPCSKSCRLDDAKPSRVFNVKRRHLAVTCPPSRQLRQCIDDLPDNLLETPAGELSSKETTSHLWDIYLFEELLISFSFS